MMEFLLTLIIATIGLAIGWALSRSKSRKIVSQAQDRANHLIAEARQNASLIIREIDTRAREEARRLRQASVALETQSTEENAHLEERVQKLEKRNEKQETETVEREATMQLRETATQKQNDEARTHRHEAKEKRQLHQQRLEQKAEETAQQIKERLSEALVEETRAQCADRLRNLESTSSEEFMRQAKRIMGISMGRYGCRLVTERSSSSMTLTTDTAEKLKANMLILRDIEELTSVHLSLSDAGDSLRFETGDGVARELARRVVVRFLAEEKIRDLPRLVKAISADLDRDIIDYGKEAFRRLGLEIAHPEIVKLIGRLSFRTSYTQNQWEHTLESAFLAGMMAAELGMDVGLARRATLLHDIGKALTHEVEGSHAVIGAEYARKYGESELVVNAIGAHHGDEPPQSAYAHLVVAADAMSGARPGARREMVETYVDRISDLERIAGQFNGVMTVHAVQAGRELRIHVDEQQVNDTKASHLSEEIARKISEEVTFPGQIRVTVIREFKAIEFAS